MKGITAMTTYIIDFTDFAGHFWTIDWTPTTSKNKNLTQDDIQAVVTFIKTGKWPQNTHAAARNCYDLLASQISNIIVDAASVSEEHSDKFIKRMFDLLDAEALSREGTGLLKECIFIQRTDDSEAGYQYFLTLLKKLVKIDHLFAVKFADDENWPVDIINED